MASRLSRRTLAAYIADQWTKGADRQRLIRQLAAYLLENRRTDETTLLVRDIEAALAERGQVLARVTSAHEVSDQLKSELAGQIKSSQQATDIEFETHVDPDLLGGMRVELPGYEFDGTLKKRLQALKARTKEQQS